MKLHKGLYIFPISIFIIVILDVFALTGVKKLHSAYSEICKNEEFLRESERAFSRLRDAETGQRGYILTGDKTYLQPYLDAVEHSKSQDLYSHLAELRPEYADEIAMLRRLRNEKYVELQQTLDAYRAGGIEETLKIVRTNLGKNVMMKYRAVMHDLQAEVRERLNQNQEQVKNVYTLMLTLEILNTLLTLTVIIMSVILVRYYARAFQELSRRCN